MTLRDRRSDWMWIGLAAVVAGVFIGLIGPLGSFAVAPAVRIFYCSAVAVIGAVVFWPSLWFAWDVGRRVGWSPWASGLVAGATMSLPVWLLLRVLSPILWLGHGPSAPPPVKDFLETLLFLVPSVLVATYIHVLRTAARTASGHMIAVGAPPLVRRLPPALGRDVLALEAEDHYVRVYTSVGSALVLSRLADAIAGLGAIEGLRVHRSWWVARHAVRSATVERRRLSLVLSNGVIARVSRQSAPAVRREGWVGRAATVRPADSAP